jgi:hypothetical protein
MGLRSLARVDPIDRSFIAYPSMLRDPYVHSENSDCREILFEVALAWQLLGTL